MRIRDESVHPDDVGSRQVFPRPTRGLQGQADGVGVEASLESPQPHAWADALESVPEAALLIAGIAGPGRILYLNSLALRMFGYDRGEIVNQSFDMLVPLRLARMAGALPLHGRRRDGTEFPVDVLVNASGGSAAAVSVAILRDLTARTTAEDILTRARDSAVQASEVKSRFLAAASHDLRQPLQTIWTLQAVLARAFAETKYAPHVAALEEAVRTMDQMLCSLIDINRLEVGAIQPVISDFPLREILARLRSEFSYTAAGKSLSLDIEDSSEFARSDRMLLPVILRNLVGNAVKYTRQGTVRLRVRADADELHIDIADTGIGIPPQHLRRLFEAFYQVDNRGRDQRGGVGLGLSIVQSFCRLLDHAVSIESRIGEGSTFTVRLPRGVASEVTAKIEHIPVLVPVSPAGSVKVLHIEDDPGVARSMALLLRLQGYEVISASTRDEALQQVQVHALRPDLILSDYQLPMGFRGDEIVAEIATSLGFKPPTIMLTGDTADNHVEKAKLVADRILPKPVDVNLLLREIEKLLDARH